MAGHGKLCSNAIMRKQGTQNAIRLRLAYNVRRLRLAAGISQDELSAKSGLATRHLQKIEAGSVNITLNTAAALADGLGVDVHILFAKSSS